MIKIYNTVSNRNLLNPDQAEAGGIHFFRLREVNASQMKRYHLFESITQTNVRSYTDRLETSSLMDDVPLKRFVKEALEFSYDRREPFSLRMSI